MRWNNFNTKKFLIAAGVLCCGLAISSSSAEPQFPVQPTPSSDQSRKEAPAPAPSPAVPQPSPAAENQRRTPEFFVMIDPSHGGYDKGADFGGKLLEKDITLKLARELRKELEERGIASRLLRDSDVDIALERRAEITNEQRAGIYIALHAGRLGHGVRVYTPLLTGAEPPTGRFLPWESAQSASLERSKAAAQAIAGELRKKDFTVVTLGSSVRPLNNVITAAIAVEVAPEGNDVQTLESARRNSGVATAIASAIAQLRSQTGARP
jgi:N-acetylmuramoyl-L-alanine amidase